MTTLAALRSGSAAELARQFDLAFAAPPREEEEPEDLLTVRVGGDPYALRVHEVAGVERCRRIVPLPSRIPELCGVVGIRGAVLPVYDLAQLLGYGSGVPGAGWVVLCGDREPVGLGLAEFEGHLRVAQSAIHAAVGGEALRAHVCQVVRAGETLHAVISVPSVLETLRGRAATFGSPRER